MDPNQQLIDKITRAQLEGLLEHFQRGGGTIYDRESAAKCLSSLAMVSRLQAGEAVDISRITEGSSFEDALAQLDEDS